MQDHHLAVVSPLFEILHVNGFLHVDWFPNFLDVEPKAVPLHHLEKVGVVLLQVHPVLLPYKVGVALNLRFVNHLRPSVVSALEPSNLESSLQPLHKFGLSVYIVA